MLESFPQIYPDQTTEELTPSGTLKDLQISLLAYALIHSDVPWTFYSY